MLVNLLLLSRLLSLVFVYYGRFGGVGVLLLEFGLSVLGILVG